MSHVRWRCPPARPLFAATNMSSSEIQSQRNRVLSATLLRASCWRWARST
jgi:hypothetical protein